MTLSLLYGPTLTSTHDYWKNHSLTVQTFVSKITSQLFNTLCLSLIKNLPAMLETSVQFPRSGRSPEEGHDNSLQYSYLENSMDRESWWATVHGVAKSWTPPSDYHNRFVKAFLPRSKHLLISWLQSPSCSDFGAQENKVCHSFHCFHIYLR